MPSKKPPFSLLTVSDGKPPLATTKPSTFARAKHQGTAAFAKIPADKQWQRTKRYGWDSR